MFTEDQLSKMTEGGGTTTSFDPRTATTATTHEQAIELARAWADGRRSWINMLNGTFGDRARALEVCAVMDAHEVVKWAALASVLPSGPRDDGGRADDMKNGTGEVA